MKTLLPLLITLLALQSCATNPVTGRSELSLISTSEELAIGEENYLPTQQSQGGKLQIDPGLSAYIQSVGDRLAAVSDRQLPYEFVVLNNSVPNAWALPGGKIAINRGLLTALDNEAELAAVLGHEIVHAAARHTARAQTRAIVLQGALIAGAISVQDNDYADLIVGGAALGSQLITQRYGREAELESDQYGTEYMLRAGYDPNGAVTLMEKFVALSEGRQSSWIDGLFASHPPSQQRLDDVRAQVAAMDLSGRDLELGQQRYQQEMALLMEAQPAYTFMDEAVAAARENDMDTALTLLQRARTILPQEGRFDGLRGDILLEQGRYDDAIEAYNAALSKDDAYFEYYLGRGVANSRLGNRSAARSDLQRSSELLPTAAAAMELGNLALADTDRDSAKQYFQIAAQGGGRVGERAATAYQRLNLQDNPGTYIRTAARLGPRGELLADVVNASMISVNVELEFRALIGGRVESSRRNITGLAAGAASAVNSGLRLPVLSSNTDYEVRIAYVRPD